jgi:hypothetical protein
MYRKNVANQPVWAQMNSMTDGTALTADVSVKVAYLGNYGDGAGTLTHKGGGQWEYVFTQGETNHDQFGYQFNHADAVSKSGTIVPTAANPTDAVRFGLTALPNAAADAAGGLPISDAGGLDLDTVLGRILGTIAAGTHNPQSGDAFARLGAPVLASISADIQAIVTSMSLIAPTTDAADSSTVTYGTEIAGTYVKTQTDDNDRYSLAPIAVSGLDLTMVFEIGLGRAPVSVTINGYWSGSGQYCNVYAYDYILGIWDCLTNSSTRMGHRTSDANYSYPLNREHIDPDTGDVSIRFVSPSTNTAHRLHLDRVLVGTIDQSQGANAGITAQDVWAFASRTLTSDTGEPVDTNAIAAACAALILVTPAQKVVTDASGYVTANVNGTIEVSGDVVLAASQPNYAPAKAADIPTSDITAIKDVTDKLDTALALDGAVYRYTANALELGPTGSGLDAAGVRAAIGLNSANLDSQLDAIPTAAENAALVLATPANKLATDASGNVTANVTGTVIVSGDVTLASSQPNYAPAKASDIPTSDITAIKNKTDNLPSDPADQSLVIAATDSIVSAITSLGAPMQAGTAVEVNDKTGFKLASDGLDVVAAPADLANDTAARATFVGMFRAMFNRFYNKVTQTSTVQVIYNDSNAAVSSKAASNDGSTQTLGKSA